MLKMKTEADRMAQRAEQLRRETADRYELERAGYQGPGTWVAWDELPAAAQHDAILDYMGG